MNRQTLFIPLPWQIIRSSTVVFLEPRGETHWRNREEDACNHADMNEHIKPSNWAFEKLKNEFMIKKDDIFSKKIHWEP